MPTFVLKQNCGVAVVVADDAEEALKLLAEKEKQDDCISLTHRVSPADLKEIGLKQPKGVVTYYSN